MFRVHIVRFNRLDRKQARADEKQKEVKCYVQYVCSALVQGC